MAFRATNVIPQTAYLTVKANADQLRRNLIAYNAQMAASATDYDRLREIYRTLERSRAQLVELSTTPGIAAEAQTQEDDVTYDVVAEFNALIALIVSAQDWIEANVPLSVTVKSVDTWDDGTLISNTFSPAATAGLRTQLQSVIDGIV